ncbi:hypothetical protein M407DRAFT_180618 [Tulasnella calospora MUT 4182]|uniref:Uncharacterized protein n=1 Tax=Tulasnella calospora MUT 4182 TaxID=1051891 RepID=A0A0C3L5X2_9AGAM|nr:hypothetical protein M407DRAFT_180618 [Tulasnella calospora MUT 4182]
MVGRRVQKSFFQEEMLGWGVADRVEWVSLAVGLWTGTSLNLTGNPRRVLLPSMRKYLAQQFDLALWSPQFQTAISHGPVPSYSSKPTT